MKDRLKRFFLSMFSDKYVEESTEYGIGNLLITSLIAAVLLFVGVFAGRYLLFGADYASAPQFREFAYNAFIDENISVRIDGTGAAQVTVGEEAITVNTYANVDDRDKFGMYGYGLIVDPAPSTAYDDFTAYCNNKDNGAKIDYEAYLALFDDAKKRYSFAVEYGGTVKTVSEAQAEEYLAFLQTVDKASAELAEIEESKGSVPVEDYRNSLWALYVKYYYPDMFAATGEDVPTLGGYYYGFVAHSNKYLCIFGDMTTVAFTTSIGKRMTVGFAYDGLDSLDTDGNASISARENEVDAFIKDGYFGGLSARVFADFMDWVLVIVIAELVIALAIFLCWAVCKRLNIRLCRTFSDSAKAIGSYAHIAAFISAVVALLSGFLFVGMTVALIGMIAFFVVLATRTAVLIVRRYKKEKREYEEELDEKAI